MIHGDEKPGGELRRYWKFFWKDLSALPPLGMLDYQPKIGAMRLFAQGDFTGEHLERLPAIKTRRRLEDLGYCAYCGQSDDSVGNEIALSSEHIIPEFLGSGLELPASSCAACQKATSAVEYTIAREMFGPVRKSFGLRGKDGVLPNVNFPLDVGSYTSEELFMPIAHYPTVLVLPALFPASTYSRRGPDSADPFNFLLYNINADRNLLARYAIDGVSTQSVDLVRFAQMIAKVAHSYATHYWRAAPFTQTVSSLIRTIYPPQQPAIGHLAHVGCLLGMPETPTSALHEIEAGQMRWGRIRRRAVRVRLFASYGMPSYYVTVSEPED
ncbi:hypothetical protein [Devosia riboflavina]|nr:hypothetical protein [Devosia riboflavina]